LTDADIEQFDARLRALLDVQAPDVALDPDIEVTIECDGYVRHRITYMVDRGERIAAYLLIPDGSGTRPAIVAAHQHGGDFLLGKSEPAGLSRNPMYHYGLDLCRRGYVVICPDHLAFEERVLPEWRRRDDPGLADFWWERFCATKLFLEGSSLQAKYLADLVKAIDYLETLPEVDRDRIGVIGHSLGGQEAAWLTWFDRRIKAGASSCGFAMIRAIIDHQINHNMALYVPGFLKLGDMDLLVAAMAPRAFCFTAGDEDVIFPIESVRHIASAVGEVYQRQGIADRFLPVIFSGGHGFPDDVKAQVYGFLDFHLQAG
jgi:dienelactone hydrolase